MAFLVIAGQTIRVAVGSQSKQQTNRMVGEEAAAFSGLMRNSFRAEKRVFQFQTAYLLQSDMTTLRTNTALGAYVTCSGDALGGSVTCRVIIGDAVYAKVSTAGGGYRWVATLTLQEQ